MRFTPHQAIAGAAAIIAVLLVAPTFTGFDIRSGEFTQEPRIILDQVVRAPVSADMALKPVYGEHVDLVDINNPFAVPVKGPAVIGGSRLPPPPPFELPDPPPMPLPGK